MNIQEDSSRVVPASGSSLGLNDQIETKFKEKEVTEETPSQRHQQSVDFAYRDKVQKSISDVAQSSQFETYNFPTVNATVENTQEQIKLKHNLETGSSRISRENGELTEMSVFEKTGDQRASIKVDNERTYLPIIIQSDESRIDEEIGITNSQYNKLINSNTNEETVKIIDQDVIKSPLNNNRNRKIAPFDEDTQDKIKEKLNMGIKNKYKDIHTQRRKSMQMSSNAVTEQAIQMENRIQKQGKSISGFENMKQYMEDYSTSIDVPSLYVQDAKFFHTNPDYVLKILNVVNPMSKDTIIQNHWIDRKNMKHTLSKDINEDLTQGLILRLIKTKEKRILILQDILIKKVHFAKIKFSFDGTLLVMFYKDLQQIKVCKINDIENLLPEIQKGKFHSEYDGILEQDISFINNVEIDYNNRFVIGRGERKAFIYNIETRKTCFYNLDNKLYQKIYNIRLVSKSNESYRCQIACKKKDVKQVHIFEMFGTDEESKKLKVLNFQHEDTDLTMVDISFDFKQIVFVNQAENFEIADMGTYYVQRNLNQLKNKIVRYISHSPELDGFYFIAHLEYDQFLDVDHSKRTDFLVDFQRDVEPGIIKIFDFAIIKKDSPPMMKESSVGLLPDINDRAHSPLPTETGRGVSAGRTIHKEIQLISLRDDDFIIDSATYNEQLVTSHCNRNEQGYADTINKKYKTDNIVYNQFQHKPIGSFCISWPYLAFCSMNRFLVIWNVFEKKTLHVVEVGDLDSNLFVEDTYITQTNDLILVARVGENYSIYLIDLDESNINEFEGKIFDYDNQFKFKLLFQYKSEDVNHKPLSNIHARGSSRKEAVDTNNKLIIFLLHDQNLYSWVQLHEQSSNQEAFRFVGKFHSKEFMLLDDSKFVYLENFYNKTKQVIRQEIKYVSINFSTYSIMNIHSQSEEEKIISINLDQISHKLIILQDVQSTQDSIDRKKFKIFDLNNMKILFETMIKNKPLIGRLASGMYTFVDGHIYYNNNVIKIRYDIVQHINSQRFLEDDIFDYYYNIFQLKQNETVKASTPLDSFRSHRFGYVITNSTDMKPKRVMITPYLHDTRIYLNRIKINTNYFYTSIESASKKNPHSFKEVKISESAEVIEDQSAVSLDYGDDEPTKDKNIMVVSELQKDLLSISEDYQQKNLTFTSIICFNLTEHKFYVYSQSGLLLHRCNFQSEIDKYGEPKDVFSSNGRVFIFQKSYEQIQKTISSNRDLLKQMLKINIMEADAKKLNFIKEISLYDIIQELVPNDSCLKTLQSNEDYIELIDVQYALNNKTDVLISVKEKPAHEQKSDIHLFHDGQHECTYYFYVKQSLNADGKPNVQMIEDHDQIENFTINDEYIFIWTKKSVKYFKLTCHFELDHAHIIDLNIDQDEKHISILEVRVGSDPNQLIIVVDQSLEKLVLFRWDMEFNKELDYHQIDHDYRIVWDKKGNPYCMMKDKTLIFEQNCIVKAFGCSWDRLNDQTCFQNGHKFDHKNHNWVIQQEYLDLPFCYMTFVILDKIEQKDTSTQLNVFDPVPYNYIYNRRTFFLNSEFVKKDHVMLNNVLNNLQKQDPALLDLINYTQKIEVTNNRGQTQVFINSALGIAHHEGNNKAVELLLKFLSQVQGGQSITDYVQMFPQLLQYKNFVTYLKMLPIRNFQMERKQILQVEGQVNDQIVRITYFHTSYIDQKFFNIKMDEVINNEDQTKLQNQSKIKRPVDIQAVQIDWILCPDGKKFLVSILNNQNLDYYSISSLQMIIEFLFSNYKKIILSSSFPLFAAQTLTFFLQIQMNESAHYKMRHTLKNQVTYNEYKASQPRTIWDWEEGTHQQFSEVAINILFVLNVFTFLIQLIEIRAIVRQLIGSWGTEEMKNSARQVFLDSVFIIVTLAINVQVFFISRTGDMEDYYQTRINYMKYIRYESLIIVPLLFIKIVNIFTLFDSISPFVDIVFKIFSDIMFFMFIFLVTIISMAQCFYIVGQNQIWFGDITLDEYNDVKVRYDTIINSLWYVWLLTLGEFNYDSFFIGNQQQTLFLVAIFTIATFLMIVHMLNMLIAIMGATYMARSEVSHNIRTRDHLKFVIENWHLKSNFKDLKKMKYIICAFVDHQFSGSETNTQIMTEEIYNMQHEFRANQELNIIKQNELSHQINNLTKKLESHFKKDNGHSW